MKVNFSLQRIPKDDARLDLAARVRQELERPGLVQEHRGQLETMCLALDRAVLSKSQLRDIEQELAALLTEAKLPPKSTARVDTKLDAKREQRPLFIGHDKSRMGQHQVLLQLPKAEGKALTVSVEVASEQEVEQFLEAFDGLLTRARATEIASLFEQTEALMGLGAKSALMSRLLVGAGVAVLGISAAVYPSVGDQIAAVGTLLGLTSLAVSQWVPNDPRPQLKEARAVIEQVVSELVSDALRSQAGVHFVESEVLGSDCAPVSLEFGRQS